MSDDDTAMVIRARDSGDRAAFEELIRRTSRLVYARLILECGNVHKAEDLVQETYLLAFRSLHRLRSPEGFRAWLLSIARNALTDDARHHSRQKRLTPQRDDTSLSFVASTEPAPGEQLEKNERREQVLSALRSLPEEYQMPLTLRYLAGADAETIGTQLGLTNGSLRGLLHRGLKLLRERLPADLQTENG